MSQHPHHAIFVSEPVQIDPCDFDTALMSIGLASPPRAFSWRGNRYEIVELVSHHKQSTPEGGTIDKERYLRRQVFEVRLHTGQRATLYIERHYRRGSGRNTSKRRWYLFSITSSEES